MKWGIRIQAAKYDCEVEYAEGSTIMGFVSLSHGLTTVVKRKSLVPWFCRRTERDEDMISTSGENPEPVQL